jgi:hypothetical protein
MKEINPEILRSVHGISLEAALITDRVNKHMFYNQHTNDFKEFLSVDLADLYYYVTCLAKELGIDETNLKELSQVKLAHFYKVRAEGMTLEREQELLNKFSSTFQKYKHAKPY